MHRLVLCIVASLFVRVASAQSVQIIFHPINPYFFNTDQAWNYSVINTSGTAISGYLEVTVLREGIYQIYDSKTGIITLLPGENTGQLFISKIISNEYSTDQSGSYFRNTSLLPAGNFSLCVWVKTIQNTILNNFCEEINVKAITLPILTYPYDGEELSTALPNLNWIPVMPQGIPSLQYLLELWKVGSDKITPDGPVTSLKTGSNNFQYNSTLTKLTEGNTYEWQVSAYTGDYYLGKSQTWQFRIKEDNSNSYRSSEDEDSVEEAAVDSDSYRVMADETYGAEYIATGTLRIAFNNIALDSLFDYKIAPIDQPDQYLTGLPVTTIGNGLNKIKLDLASTGLFENQKDYTLEIEDGNGKNYFLTFRYLNP